MKKRLIITFSILLSAFLVWLVIYTIIFANKEQINTTSLFGKENAARRK